MASASLRDWVNAGAAARQFSVFGHKTAPELISQSEKARIIGIDAVAGGDGQDRRVRNAGQFPME